MKNCFCYIILIVLCSCSSDEVGVKSGGDRFFAVDFLAVEKMKGEEILISDLVESFEVIRLDNKDEALIQTYPFGIFVTDNYILLKPTAISPVKLFTRKGRYVADIGGIGQGPGEYKVLFSSMMDEKHNRIYLGPSSLKRVFVYDLKGSYLSDEVIHLGEVAHKFQIWLDYDKKAMSVVTLPFSADERMKIEDSKNICWVQDYEGNIEHKISAKSYAIGPDASNGLIAFRNVDAISFSIFEDPMLRTRPDTLYHYDTKGNIIIPCFTLDYVVDENRRIATILYETSNSYWARVTLYPNDISSSSSPVRLTTFNVCVSKKDGNVRRIDRFTDPLLGLSYPYLVMQNGYVCISYDPLELMDALDKVLTQTDLEPDVRKRATDLRNSLHENDNDILIIGKLKQ